jgi:hypothetical protein
LTGQLDCVGVRAAWRSAGLQDQNFVSHPFGNGWLLDRARFGETLRRAAVAAGALLRAPARLTRLARESAAAQGWRLRLSDGEEGCDWLVDATGRRGAVAHLLGIKRRRFDRQVALVGWLATDRADDVDATLTVETTSSGWWYGCRLPGRRRVAGFVTASRPDARTWESRLRATRHRPAGDVSRERAGRAPRGSDDPRALTGPADAIGDAAVATIHLLARARRRAVERIETASLLAHLRRAGRPAAGSRRASDVSRSPRMVTRGAGCRARGAVAIAALAEWAPKAGAMAIEGDCHDADLTLFTVIVQPSPRHLLALAPCAEAPSPTQVLVLVRFVWLMGAALPERSARRALKIIANT